ncbi:MAG TPA: type II toxin-antitoxin system RelE/ParE family toxin [Terriglobia bacterium]|nr:type II toxin-antitoxin system RelE/ParE family toxin [Terriglobia bacterium]
MKGFILSPEAARDIREIWAYIAEDNVAAARRVRLQLLAACRRIGRSPRIGHSREDLTHKPVLFWPVGSYLVIYNPAQKPVQIVRVLHGRRDIPSLL